MFEALRRRIRRIRARVDALERRQSRGAQHWLAETSNLTHASVLLFVPLLIGLVTLLSNELQAVSFLVFPPLASGTYTLFAEPEGKYADPVKFVGGMSLGAFCGWVAIEITALVTELPHGQLQVHAWAAALAIFLTGLFTWGLDLEVPTAFSTALLVLLTDPGTFVPIEGVEVSTALVYVLTVAASSGIVAVVFVLWRREFYQRRARYLYTTTQADDHVLVPMRGETDAATTMLGARLAAAHDAGKVVLLDVVDDDDVAATERRLLEEREAADDALADGEAADLREVPDLQETAERTAADEAAAELERRAARVEASVGVPCEVVVAVEAELTAASVLDAARETNCDLVVTPLERAADGTPTTLVRELFRSDIDVVAFDSKTDRTEWKRVMVPVDSAGPLSHAMVDYGQRLAGRTGTVSVCTTITDERSRRNAESMLANLTETTTARCETRVSRSTLDEFVARNESHYDLVVLGAHHRGTRFTIPEAFERAADVGTDVAVVHTR